MKKILVSALLVICMLVMLIPAVHAENLDAFTNIVLDGSTEKYIDDSTTNNQGGNGKSIGYVEGYGCGNSSLNDIVAFEDVDFGTAGAKSITLFFAYYGQNDQTTDLDIYYDDYSDEAFIVGTCKISDTGGWSVADAKELTFPVDIPSGVHNVYIKFTTANSGSFTYVRFGAEALEGDDQPSQEYTGDPLADNAVINIFADELLNNFRLKHEMLVSVNEGNLKFTAPQNTTDPYVTFDVQRYYSAVKSTPVTADDYSCVVIKLKADDTIYGNSFELFAVCNDVEEAGIESANVTVTYDATGDWEYILFDFSICPSWYGTIKTIRLDWTTGAIEGESMEIAEMRFLKDEEAGLKFIAEMTGGEEPTVCDRTEPHTEPETSVAQETTVADVTTAAEAGTTAVADDAATTGTDEKKSGCGGVIGGIALIAAVSLAGVCIRKKH